jgi:hypothetical protein
MDLSVCEAMRCPSLPPYRFLFRECRRDSFFDRNPTLDALPSKSVPQLVRLTTANYTLTIERTK